MASSTSSATQKFVPLKEIRNGVVILKDGGYRGILLCSSLNFGLKSADEQRAIMLGFQNFLNTLDFSVQIVVNSRVMDLRPYLASLEKLAPQQSSELMRHQLREYIAFIQSFSEQSNIMSKSFYVVVPYTPTITASSTANLLNRGKTDTSGESFDRDRIQLEQRVSLVAGGLSQAGIRAQPLGTEEVIELMYRAFNPGELENPIHLDA